MLPNSTFIKDAIKTKSILLEGYRRSQLSPNLLEDLKILANSLPVNCLERMKAIAVSKEMLIPFIERQSNLKIFHLINIEESTLDWLCEQFSVTEKRMEFSFEYLVVPTAGSLVKIRHLSSFQKVILLTFGSSRFYGSGVLDEVARLLINTSDLKTLNIRSNRFGNSVINSLVTCLQNNLSLDSLTINFDLGAQWDLLFIQLQHSKVKNLNLCAYAIDDQSQSASDSLARTACEYFEHTNSLVKLELEMDCFKVSDQQKYEILFAISKSTSIQILNIEQGENMLSAYAKKVLELFTIEILTNNSFVDSMYVNFNQISVESLVQMIKSLKYNITLSELSIYLQSATTVTNDIIAIIPSDFSTIMNESSSFQREIEIHEGGPLRSKLNIDHYKFLSTTIQISRYLINLRNLCTDLKYLLLEQTFDKDMPEMHRNVVLNVLSDRSSIGQFPREFERYSPRNLIVSCHQILAKKKNRIS